MKKIIILSASILIVGIFAVLKSANPGSEIGIVESKLVIVHTLTSGGGGVGFIEVIYGDSKIEKVELETEVPKNHVALWDKIHATINKFIVQGYNIQSTSGDGAYRQYILVKE